eukprot:GILJ01001911.1.p1 GENE.GILJ01001911.1~~GILJ01001911.1.p1  ORF type:complete len:347 (+),score=61.17 GILJ01001911.1:52-1092(+)
MVSQNWRRFALLVAAAGIAAVSVAALVRALRKTRRGAKRRVDRHAGLKWPSERIVIHNPDAFFAKREKMRADGPGSVQVVSDFDMTLTAFMVDGQRGMTSHGIVERAPMVSDEFRQRSRALFEQYFPLEHSKSITVEEKFQHMTEWWKRSHQLICEEHIHLSDLSLMVGKAHVAVREGVTELFQELDSFNIPVTIISAGIKDVIEAVLKARAVFTKNIRVLSNKMFFDSEGLLVGFDDDNNVIHSMNKGRFASQFFSSTPELAQRKNVILLGDLCEDLTMAEGLNYDSMISVGFLNDPTKVEEMLPHYQEVYDVVVINDGSVDFVADLIKFVCCDDWEEDVHGPTL